MNEGLLTNFLDDIPVPTAKGMGSELKNELLCKHDIIAEWCSDCKHLSTGSVKQVLLNENLAIVENLLQWPRRDNRISSR